MFILQKADYITFTLFQHMYKYSRLIVTVDDITGLGNRLWYFVVLRAFKVHSSRENGVCTDHSCVYWWREVLLRRGLSPANTLVVLRISSGSRGRDYSLPWSSILHACVWGWCFLNDVEQQHSNWMQNTFRLDAVVCQCYSIVCKAMKISQTDKLIQIEIHGSYNP